MTLSVQAQKVLVQYLLSLNQHSQAQESARQAISANTYFQLETVFSRFDKLSQGYLVPSDFAQFMLENQVIATEEEIYLVFRDFDSKREGKVDLEDFTREILPRENTRLKKEVLTRKSYNPGTRLDGELQFQIGRYLSKKLEEYKSRVKISDELIRAGFSISKGFELIAEGKSVIEGIEAIDKVLRKNGIGLKNEDLRRILSSLAFNQRNPVDLTVFESHIDPFKHGFYPGYKAQLAIKLQQKAKYSNIVQARRLLLEQRKLNDFELGRLYDGYNIVRDENLRRSRTVLEQSREQVVYQEERMNNLRMSREIEREGIEISELAHLRARLLGQEQLVRSRRVYDYI